MGDNEKLWGCLTKLKDLERDGIIDPETAQELMKSKKERILEKFPPKQAGDGGWFVTIRFAPGPHGRKMIKKTKREDLEKAVCEYVGENLKDLLEDQKKDYRYKTAFDNWIKSRQYQNKNSELRNKRAYKRFFENFEPGRKMAQRDIRQISATEIEQFMSTLIREFKIKPDRVTKTYGMFFKSLYEQAIRDRLITPYDNPCLFVLPKRFVQIAEAITDESPEDRVIDDKTQELIVKTIQEDHQKRKSYMNPFVCELSILTGMRIGELVGLEWKNVDLEHGVFYIVQSLKYDETTRTYYISTTKNKKKRQFPITDEIKDLFMRIQEVQKEYGKTEDFVFSNGNRRCTTHGVQNYLWQMKRRKGIDSKITIHAERRTLNSVMAANGVPIHTRAALLGHLPAVNQKNYTYDVIPLDEKRDIISQAHR